MKIRSPRSSASPRSTLAIDAVGFEAKSHGQNATEAPAAVLNSLMSITRAAGSIGIPGLYVTEDPGAKDKAAQTGNLSMRFGLGWAKSQRFFTGQTPVLKYNRQLMQAILHDRLPIAKIVNATVITLDDAPQGYKDFDKGAAKKFVIDPHNLHQRRGVTNPSTTTLLERPCREWQCLGQGLLWEWDLLNLKQGTR